MTKHSTKQKSEIVIKQFEDQIADYTDNALVEYSAVTPFLQKWWKKNPPKKKVSIGEFGGGGGNLLAYLATQTGRSLKLTNIELVGKYKRYQVDKSIAFVEGSVIDSPFRSDFFDITIVRNVLHHLVAGDLATTRDNQLDAIRELLRVTKPGGFVIIEEQVNQNRLATLIFYYASQLATKLNIRIDRMQITPNTIVGYMTRTTLQWMCERHVRRSSWIKDEYHQWNLPWYWKMTGLMSDTGEAFIVLKKPLPDAV